MTRYVIKSIDSQAVRRLIKKHGTLPIQTDTLDGVIEIVRYRHYQFDDEVDITFKGKIYVGVGGSSIWIDFKYYQDKIDSISKVKLTRFFRRQCFDSVQTRMFYFGVRLSCNPDIKTVKWIG